MDLAEQTVARRRGYDLDKIHESSRRPLARVSAAGSVRFRNALQRWTLPAGLACEGLNNPIQTIKKRAYGFRVVPASRPLFPSIWRRGLDLQ